MPDDGPGLRQVLLSPRGRLARLDMLFALFCVAIILAAIGLLWLGFATLLVPPEPVATFMAWLSVPLAGLALIGLVLFAFILAKRCHDRDRSAWFLLVLLVPAVQLWPLFELIFGRGSPQANQFGPAPRGMVAQWQAINGDL